MKKTYIAMTSITYAYKAKTLFEREGIHCDVIRTPRNIGSGCGYSLETDSDPYTVTKMLIKNGIKFKEVYK